MMLSRQHPLAIKMGIKVMSHRCFPAHIYILQFKIILNRQLRFLPQIQLTFQCWRQLLFSTLGFVNDAIMFPQIVFLLFVDRLQLIQCVIKTWQSHVMAPSNDLEVASVFGRVRRS